MAKPFRFRTEDGRRVVARWIPEKIACTHERVVTVGVDFSIDADLVGTTQERIYKCHRTSLGYFKIVTENQHSPEFLRFCDRHGGIAATQMELLRRYRE